MGPSAATTPPAVGARIDTPLDAGTIDRYRRAQPYPHAVFDNFADPAVARELLAEFPPVEADTWTNYTHVNERKFGRSERASFPPAIGAVVDELNAPPFIAWLERLTGISGLRADPGMEGGGLHQSRRGGHLNIHADFTGHPRHPSWRRRVNVLLYLNDGWQPEWGGDLELWSRDMRQCVQRVAPLFNRALIFNTEPDSFHGHPDPIACPEGVTRKSLALYYFTEERAPFVVRSTEYRPRPGDGAKRIAIWADKLAVRAYDKVKRRFGLDDRFASRVLRLLSRRRDG
jgi:hypothetical protein